LIDCRYCELGWNWSSCVIWLPFYCTTFQQCNGIGGGCWVHSDHGWCLRVLIISKLTIMVRSGWKIAPLGSNKTFVSKTSQLMIQTMRLCVMHSKIDTN